jgi:hypothetical protein
MRRHGGASKGLRARRDPETALASLLGEAISSRSGPNSRRDLAAEDDPGLQMVKDKECGRL